MTNDNQDELKKYVAILLSRRDFTGENLSDAKLQGVDFHGCVMEGVILDDADLTGANMKECDLYWGFLCGANFTNANLENAKLNGANLKDANLTSANLCGTDFGADAFGKFAEVSNANFTGAVYDHKTVFPKNFDPLANKMVKSIAVS
jgi:uncharacterized protein YjbI with pentapeptide repeats